MPCTDSESEILLMTAPVAPFSKSLPFRTSSLTSSPTALHLMIKADPTINTTRTQQATTAKVAHEALSCWNAIRIELKRSKNCKFLKEEFMSNCPIRSTVSRELRAVGCLVYTASTDAYLRTCSSCLMTQMWCSRGASVITWIFPECILRHVCIDR